MQIASRWKAGRIRPAVRNSTSVLYQEGLDIEYYLYRAGGLTSEADRKGLYIQRADGSAVTGFSKLRKVEAGDAVIVPPKVEVQYRPVSIAQGYAHCHFAKPPFDRFPGGLGAVNTAKGVSLTRG